MAQVVALVDRDAREGTVRRSACALLTLARRLGEPVAVCAGEPDAAAISVLRRFGATEIWCPDAPGETSATDLLAGIARRLTPAAILIAASRRGQETAARLAIRLDSGIITDAVDVRPGPIAVQRCLADSHLVESTVVRGIPIITVRPEAAVPEPSPAAPAPAPPLHTIAVDPSTTRAPRIIATPRPRGACPALDHADVVVAGGRGIGSPAAFAVLADIAEALGAALAGSHTAAELGWIPPEARVGITGKTVNPRLYLACGLSGSVRHRAGMQGAQTVVAIGDDPTAPIFKLAELAVLGDARAILPALLAEIRARVPDSR